MKRELAATVPHVHGADQWQALREYLCVHGDPAKLPADFWRTPTCPRFIPPASVYRSRYAGTLLWVNGHPMTHVLRSAGFYCWESPDDLEYGTEFVFRDDGHHRWGGVPQAYAEQHLRYHQIQRVWEATWKRHREEELRAEGRQPVTYADEETSEPRDRILLLADYHDLFWTPADLPDWFFCAPEPPPFLPRTRVSRYRYDRHRTTEGGEPYTTIRASQGWLDTFGKRPKHVPEADVDHEPEVTRRSTPRLRNTPRPPATTSWTRQTGSRSARFGAASGACRERALSRPVEPTSRTRSRPNTRGARGPLEKNT